MKRILFPITLSLALVTSPAFSALTAPSINTAAADVGGSNAGNGGSKIILDFKTFGAKFLAYLGTPSGKALFPEVDAEAFGKALSEADVDVVRKLIRDRDGRLKTARNLSVNGEALIEIHRRSWRKDSTKPLTALRTSVHEYFGAAKIGGDAERLHYQLSLRITPDVGYAILIGSPSGTPTSPVSPLDAEEAVLAEIEARKEKADAAVAAAKSAAEAEADRVSTELNATEVARNLHRRIDLASIRTMKCAEKILDRRLGGKFSIDYAAATLRELQDLRYEIKTDAQLAELKKPAERCERLVKTLHAENVKHWEMMKYANESVGLTESTGVSHAVFALLEPKLALCRDTKISLTAGALFAGRVGVGAADCKLTNGVRWFAVGANAGLGAGGGAS